MGEIQHQGTPSTWEIGPFSNEKEISYLLRADPRNIEPIYCIICTQVPKQVPQLICSFFQQVPCSVLLFLLLLRVFSSLHLFENFTGSQNTFCYHKSQLSVGTAVQRSQNESWSQCQCVSPNEQQYCLGSASLIKLECLTAPSSSKIVFLLLKNEKESLTVLSFADKRCFRTANHSLPPCPAKVPIWALGCTDRSDVTWIRS